jgi:acetyl-CoA acyltransferase
MNSRRMIIIDECRTLFARAGSVYRDPTSEANQVGSNIWALESETWARDTLGRSSAVGRVDRERLDVCGRSVALGHPFRCHPGTDCDHPGQQEMKRWNVGLDLVSVCAQAGMGFAMVLGR